MSHLSRKIMLTFFVAVGLLKEILSKFNPKQKLLETKQMLVIPIQQLCH